MIDQTEIAQLVAKLMDEIEADYGDDVELGDAVIAVELVLPDDRTVVEHRCTSRRAVVFAGLAAMIAESSVDGERGDE